ncbi:MAG: ribosome maturation factor RimP, partial [Firmicutes bacterium]|nr:ribosome maturation factor RimP [Bacillota bacterium]
MKSNPGAQQNTVREIAQSVADRQGFELVEVTLQKEPDGLALCVYIDTPAGITLDDCERYHKAVQPLLAQIEYDYLEVSSPGADRP